MLDTHVPRMFDVLETSKSGTYQLVKQYYKDSNSTQYKIAKNGSTNGFLPLGSKDKAIEHFNNYWIEK